MIQQVNKPRAILSVCIVHTTANTIILNPFVGSLVTS